jgi:hypothetical protein
MSEAAHRTCSWINAEAGGNITPRGDLWPSPTNYCGFNQPSCFSVVPTVLSPVTEEW